MSFYRLKLENTILPIVVESLFESVEAFYNYLAKEARLFFQSPFLFVDCLICKETQHITIELEMQPLSPEE